MFPRCRKRYLLIGTLIFALFMVISSLRHLRSLKDNETGPKSMRKRIKHGNIDQEEYFNDNGIKVVVGHYTPGNSNIPALSDQEINKLSFNPIMGAGQMGRPVLTAPRDVFKMRQYYQINRFNLLASDKIPLNRSLPDMRRKNCLKTDENEEAEGLSGQKVSIVIVFHNEAWSTLLRTLHSVLLRSPAPLLEEIILVDDASTRTFLTVDLPKYLESFPPVPPVRLLRLPSRSGLIQARIHGAANSSGTNLLFLDAHCEVTKGWLPPLLRTLREDPSSVACPVIDIINDETFAYVKSWTLHRGGFNWHLQFRWFASRGGARGLRDTIESPAMAGGLFAINRRFFDHLGGYDPSMKIWGGENLELSLRVWLCGGRILIVQCSRVGHVFRRSSPYSFPGGVAATLHANLARLVLTHMGKWANFFFRANPEVGRQRDAHNVTGRRELLRTLHCKDFGHFLETVWEGHFFPAPGRFFGRVRNHAEGGCLTRPLGRRLGGSVSNQPMGVATINKCLGGEAGWEGGTFQLFVMTPEGVIATDDDICLDAPEKQGLSLPKVRIMACSGASRQLWLFTPRGEGGKRGLLLHKTNRLCLDVLNEGDVKIGKKESMGLAVGREEEGMLVLRECDGRNSQLWHLDDVTWL